MELKLVVVLLLTLVFRAYCKPYRAHGFHWRQADHYHPRFRLPNPSSYVERWQNFQSQDYQPTHKVFYPMSSEEDSTGRIIGGVNATPGQIPYQLRLLIKTTAKRTKACGAALVKAFGVQFALTAGHCIRDDPLTTAANPKTMSLIAGKHSLKTKSNLQQQRNAVRAIMHELYEPYSKDRTDDIAIVFFEPPFKLSSRVKTIELPEYLWTQPAKVEISGWGSTTDASKPTVPDILQVLQIRTLNNAECKRRFQTRNNKVTPKMICLLTSGVKIGACIGDSGGPAAALNNSNGKWYLVGLSSYHTGACGNGRSPSVYTRVSAYINWIRDQVKDYLLSDD